ncbi:MAG: hypothetical protein ACREQ9_09020 [Candidatus Binatia bacterium]
MKRSASRLSLCPPLAMVVFACTPSFTPPGESIRVQGVVEDDLALPVEVGVYERCTPRLYFFERCPGKLVGWAKIARPGPFVVEIDTRRPEVAVVAYRGVIGQEDACAVENRPIDELSKPVALALAKAPCPVALPPPIQASARAPVSGY